MPVTIDGTTGITTPAENTSALTVGSITGILKATSGVVSQAVAGTDYLTSTSGGAITLATAQTASGTAVDFTSIPSWAKRITVMFDAISPNANGNNLLIRIGSGLLTTTGYYSVGSSYRNGGNLTEGSTSTSGYLVFTNTDGSSTSLYGQMILTKISGNRWVACHNAVSSSLWVLSGTGSVLLSGNLDRLSALWSSGASFDAGTINISYE